MFQQSGGLTSQNMDYDSLKAMILGNFRGTCLVHMVFLCFFFRHETLVVGSRNMAGPPCHVKLAESQGST